MSNNPNIGSGFDDFLQQQGDLQETQSAAIKRLLASQLQKAMDDQGLSKNKMAKDMQTSRSQLDRILDPDCDKVQLNTLIRAAKACGRELRIELV